VETIAPTEPPHAEPSPAFRFLKEQPGLVISGLYLLSSAIGMLDWWWYYRHFSINVFLDSDVADFLLASFRSPTAWLIVVYTLVVAAWEYSASLRRSRRAPSKWRVLRWLGSRRYRQMSLLLTVVFIAGYIVFYAGIRAETIADGSCGQEVRVSFATSPADDRTAVLLGSTLNFVFLLDRSANRVSVHPYENVLAIESNTQR
jgi:hypothetical protein